MFIRNKWVANSWLTVVNSVLVIDFWKGQCVSIFLNYVVFALDACIKQNNLSFGGSFVFVITPGVDQLCKARASTLIFCFLWHRKHKKGGLIILRSLYFLTFVSLMQSNSSFNPKKSRIFRFSISRSFYLQPDIYHRFWYFLCGNLKWI